VWPVPRHRSSPPPGHEYTRTTRAGWSAPHECDGFRVGANAVACGPDGLASARDGALAELGVADRARRRALAACVRYARRKSLPTTSLPYAADLLQPPGSQTSAR